MKKLTLLFSSLMILSSIGVMAARPEAFEKIKKENPVQVLCIMPYQEQHSQIMEDKLSMFIIIKESFRSGEISEVDLRLQLEDVALEAESKIASLEADKEVCLSQFEEAE